MKTSYGEGKLTGEESCTWDVDLVNGNGLPYNGPVLSSSSEEEARNDNGISDLNVGNEDVIRVQQNSEQLKGSVVQWERLLSKRSLKVLLVENDDSTRHIVGALLRNCSYEVASAASELQAWNILEDFNSRIDLVLAEVVMPFLTGIGLLCGMMSHKTLKNIPVIMMSTHDSMGIVLKCLSEGAVDFLVKPIRKNELKNLWQHVWRRCHGSSGSGSESGTQTRKFEKSKTNEMPDNNTCGSDDGSGTQGSWTRRLESPPPLSRNPVVDSIVGSNVMGSSLAVFDRSDVNALRESGKQPSLELSLRRVDGGATADDRSVLRRSDSSAFSRYNGSGSFSNQNGCGGSKKGSNGQYKVEVQHHYHHYHHYHHHACVAEETSPFRTDETKADHEIHDNGVTGNGAAAACGASERTDDNGAGGDRSARREAALSKFRRKRKERCFEKKVRYQSRKELADQRPRVKGQFVRQKA